MLFLRLAIDVWLLTVIHDCLVFSVIRDDGFDTCKINCFV